MSSCLLDLPFTNGNWQLVCKETYITGKNWQYERRDYDRLDNLCGGGEVKKIVAISFGSNMIMETTRKFAQNVKFSTTNKQR